MWPLVLDFWFESQWVPRSNILPGVTNLLLMLREIMAILTGALIVAVSALSETLAIHFQTLALVTFASQILNAGSFLPDDTQLRVLRNF